MAEIVVKLWILVKEYLIYGATSNTLFNGFYLCVWYGVYSVVWYLQ